jgi:hypothetical protein
MAKVRLRFHATGPDGRQVGPVDMDVPVHPPAPRIYVQRVSYYDPGRFVWDLTGFVTSDGSTETSFKINGVSPTATEQIAISFIACSYDFAVEVGMPWSIDTQPQAVYHDVPFAIPQSGYVT